MSSPENTGLEILKIIIQSSIVVVGWIVVNELSKKREVEKGRKELISDDIDAICESIDNIFDLALSYHTEDNRNLESERKIKMTLQDCAIQISNLRNLTLEISDLNICSKNIVTLRQAITSTHFEDEHEGRIQSDSIQLEQIATAILEIKRNLKSVKIKQFRVRN